MHWGLTEFERKRIERIALDHPYFDMHAPLLTKKEIRAILAQDPRKTGPQVIAEVKKELGFNDASVTQQKRTFMDALRDASFVPSFRRTVVLGALCLSLVLFMTLTIPGRAFAEEVYTIVIQFINNSLKAQHPSSSQSEQHWEFLALSNDIDSPTLLAETIKQPIIISPNKRIAFRYTAINDDYLIIRTEYQDENGKPFTVSQEIINPDSAWGYGIDYSTEPIVIPSGINIPMYVGITNDNTIVLVGFTEQSIFRVSSIYHTSAELAQMAYQLSYCGK